MFYTKKKTKTIMAQHLEEMFLPALVCLHNLPLFFFLLQKKMTINNFVVVFCVFIANLRGGKQRPRRFMSCGSSIFHCVCACACSFILQILNCLLKDPTTPYVAFISFLPYTLLLFFLFLNS